MTKPLLVVTTTTLLMLMPVITLMLFANAQHHHKGIQNGMDHVSATETSRQQRSPHNPSRNSVKRLPTQPRAHVRKSQRCDVEHVLDGVLSRDAGGKPRATRSNTDRQRQDVEEVLWYVENWDVTRNRINTDSILNVDAIEGKRQSGLQRGTWTSSDATSGDNCWRVLQLREEDTQTTRLWDRAEPKPKRRPILPGQDHGKGRGKKGKCMGKSTGNPSKFPR